MPGAPVNGDSSLDIDVYCKGYVAWDLTAMFIQVCQVLCMPELYTKAFISPKLRNHCLLALTQEAVRLSVGMQ